MTLFDTFVFSGIRWQASMPQTACFDKVEGSAGVFLQKKDLLA